MNTLRGSIAQGFVLAGALLLPILAAIVVAARLGVELPSEFSLPGVLPFLLVGWGVPAALGLILLGYLLWPSGPPHPGSQLASLVWVGGAAALWGLGMLALLGTLVALLLRLLGAPVFPPIFGPSRFGLGGQTVLLYTPLWLMGVLALFAARKWVAQGRPPTLLE